MANLKVKITLDPTFYEIDRTNYQEAWDEFQADNADEDSESAAVDVQKV